MHIPDILRSQILRTFGPQGGEWLDRLPAIIEECTAQWQLTACVNSEIMSYNYVGFAQSREYGQVALKIGFPHFDLNTEMVAIKLYNGRNICQCYEQDEGRSAMLLERLTPGYDLTTVANSRERIGIAAELAAALPLPLEGTGLPSWSELAQKTFTKLRVQINAGERMFRLLDLAERKLGELENSGRARVLLHGDLNHWNILKDCNGWKAIDPKGQAGVACMEVGRFMLNELEIAASNNPTELMDEMTAVYFASQASTSFHAEFLYSIKGSQS